ncbi:hypothetical protein LCM10_16185 [Rossellomorea aquimaris]|uniref:hypothetical protein n=1 Tax=Rossellomorea aquimaris TaxID=189382 RepID=UPI001CD7C5CF|nr:hypothetical protein [Rossellomorea aquimaris]MCA1056541.1 hypothetical protein [Rossellomorea aquimaris]
MADVEVFIGDLTDETFHYGGGDWNHNYPRRISGFFPKGYDLFFSVLDDIYYNRIEGRQTDWGSHTCPMYPHEIMTLLEGYYTKHMHDLRVQELFQFVKQLDPEQQYGLVACEMT